MASQKRASSLDMASIELRRLPSPAPTYRSTFISQEPSFTPPQTYLPSAPKGSTSSNPYFQSVSESPKAPDGNEKDSAIRPDYHDPNHPHFAGPTVQRYSSTLPPRRRLPPKRILIPWILAIVFFLTTAWYTSILAGAHLFSVLHILPSNPTVQEISIIIDGQVFHGNVSASTIIATLPMSSTSITTQTSSAPTSSSEKAISTSTGTSHLAPKTDSSPDDNTGNNQGTTLGLQEHAVIATPTRFVTVTRRVF